MSDPQMAEPISPRLPAGPLDEATAERVREAGTVSAGERPESQVDGPKFAIGDVIGYLGLLFVLYGWHWGLYQLSESSSNRPLAGAGGVTAAVALGALGLFLRGRGAAGRRAAGVLLLIAGAEIAFAAWFLASLYFRSRQPEMTIAASPIWLGAALLLRAVLASLPTQLGVLAALTATWSALANWADRSFLFPRPEGEPLLVLGSVAWSMALALSVGYFAEREASQSESSLDRAQPDGARSRAALTRLWAGMVAVLGTFGPILAAREGERIVPLIAGDALVLVVAAALFVAGTKKRTSAYVFPAALGVLLAFTDFNLSSFGGGGGTALAMLVEGATLLGVGYLLTSTRRRFGRRRDTGATGSAHGELP